MKDVKVLVTGQQTASPNVSVPGQLAAPALVTVTEEESPGTSGQNDNPADAELIDSLGTGGADDPAADVNGNLANAGDVDFYSVDLEAGDIIGEMRRVPGP